MNLLRRPPPRLGYRVVRSFLLTSSFSTNTYGCVYLALRRLRPRIDISLLDVRACEYFYTNATIFALGAYECLFVFVLDVSIVAA